MKKTLISICLLMASSGYAQLDWRKGGNNGTPPGQPPILGTNASWNQPILIHTNGVHIATFTNTNSLTSWAGNAGKGLSIIAPPGTAGSLDLFTSSNAGAGETHARFGNSGQVSGQNNRFEFISTGASMGNYYSTFSGSGIHRFDRGQTEYGRVGTNGFWRFGENTSGPVFGGLQAARRVEVVDAGIQFRLTFSSNSSGPNTDFFSNGAGNLQIMPTGERVGINAPTNPTATLDVFGDARIRNVATATPNALIVGVADGGAGNLRVRRLDFTGNASQVLLGNGTWGTAPGAVTANNGLSVAGGNVQLGAPCNSLFPILTSAFTSSRVVYLNGNSFWMFSGAAQSGGVGFGAQPASAGLCGVGNTVEISANNQSAYGNTNASGLRFTKLTSSSPTVANGTNGVDNSKLLTVDENGDVILTDVPPGSGNGFFDCADNTGAADLLVDSKVNLNNQNLFFENNDVLGQNHIGMGYDCSNALSGKLSVLQTHPMTINASTTGVHGMNTDVANTVLLEYTGVYGEASGMQDPANRIWNMGGDFTASNATINAGVRAHLNAPATFPTNLFSLNIGGEFQTHGPGLSNYAGRFFASGGTGATYGVSTWVAFNPLPTSQNYALWSFAPTAPSHYAGFFTGDVVVNGTLTVTSDQDLKENIDELSDAMDMIEQLNPVTFDYKQSGIYERMGMAEGNQFGLIAQEVEPILPDLVNTAVFPAEYDSLGNEIAASIEFRTLNYEQLIPIMIKGMQEQQTQLNEATNYSDSLENVVADLNNRLTQLENCLSNILPALCNTNSLGVQDTPQDMQQHLAEVINIELSDKNNIILNQNVPNPFAEKTVISYTVPATVSKAQIHFYDGKGNLINTVEITERGTGEINVYANDLSTGVYTYSLVADGQIVATKRMMKH